MKKFRATAKPRLQGLNDYQKAIVYGLYTEETEDVRNFVSMEI